MPLPTFNEVGDLPPGLHASTLTEVLARFGGGSLRRQVVARRLERIYMLVSANSNVRRFIVYGSFITDKPEPNDVDVFMVMEDQFDLSEVQGEARILFDHMAAQSQLGASIFWVRSLAALGGEEAAVSHWQLKRDGTLRGIVEITGA